MTSQHLLKSIDEASKVIGKTWPLYSFVTSNPLSGYEHIPFGDAVQKAKEQLNTNVFPEASIYRQAWQQGEIEKEVITTLLKQNGFPKAPDFYLEQMESQKVPIEKNTNHTLDGIMAKWLAAFTDEGLSEWEMPGKEEGFYKAWRKLAQYDTELGIKSRTEIPKTSAEALAQVLADHAEETHSTIFAYHLSALPGWTGFINYRLASDSSWQEAYPIDLEAYLGVRLWIAHTMKLNLVPEEGGLEADQTTVKLQYVWLKAWEKSWQTQLLNTLKKASITAKPSNRAISARDAQLVFCIDTRSELIRRHVESKGNYETFGYAGFFGIAMDYKNLNDGITRKSCPPIVASAYTVTETPQADKGQKVSAFKTKNNHKKFVHYFLKRMKNMLPSAFGYVEGSGLFYGFSLLGRTLSPRQLYHFKQENTPSYEDLCQPELTPVASKEEGTLQIPLEEKIAIVKSAFNLTGWKEFAPLVFFVGHGSHTANNPFGSSLDCGACAASPGRHNARMLAKLANLPEVRKALVNEHGLHIPESTIFIGSEHNTTTDEIVIFDTEVPEAHREQLQKVKADLQKAQQTATQDRLGNYTDSVALAEKKANNWGETRPEWGLAKNAGFIVAPRSLTEDTNLDSRCFLHSYDWERDEQGMALEGIMQGPMVVTQWINNHYYFSTVDNEAFGGGSKITHNITGKFGVVQGNGGDLKMGLPLQSVRQSDTEKYHSPLRLSVLIHAPVTRINAILERNDNLTTLLDNEWIYLLVMDPTQQNTVLKYQKAMEWVLATAMDNDGNQQHTMAESSTFVGIPT